MNETLTVAWSLFPLGWQHDLLGGLLIGSGVVLLYALTGLIGRMSTVFSSSWSCVSKRAFFQQPRLTGSRVRRLVYALGLVLGAAIWWLALSDGTPLRTEVPAGLPLVGGFLVGYEGLRARN